MIKLAADMGDAPAGLKDSAAGASPMGARVLLADERAETPVMSPKCRVYLKRSSCACQEWPINQTLLSDG
jgi:hypothetical protein